MTDRSLEIFNSYIEELVSIHNQPGRTDRKGVLLHSIMVEANRNPSLKSILQDKIAKSPELRGYEPYLNQGSSTNMLLAKNQDASDVISDFTQKIQENKTIIDAAQFVRVSDFLNEPISEIPKLIDPVINQVTLGFLVGSSDTGKSTLLTQLALSVVSGTPFIGWETKAIHKSAIIVSSEDDVDSIKFRIKRMNKDLSLNYEDSCRLRIVTEWGDLLKKLEMMLKAEPVDLIILDAFGDIFNGSNTNDNTQVRQFLQPYQQLSQSHKCAVLFMHHTKKQSEQYQPSKNNLIGSQAIEGKSRVILELRNDPVNNNKHLCITKGNGLSSSFKQESYVLSFSENFVFKQTGERVPFEDLVSPKYCKSKRAEKTPPELEDQHHRAFLQGVFLTSEDVTNPALKKQMLAKLGGNDKYNRELIRLWEGKGYINNIGTTSRIKWTLTMKDIEEVCTGPLEPLNLKEIPF